MSNGWPLVALKELMRQDTSYVTELDPRMYPKLSVKWWGKGAVLDTPADGGSVKMSRHQLAKPGQVIVSEIWAKHGSIGVVPPEGVGALITSHFYLFDLDAARILSEYMGYIIQSNYLTPLLADIAQGTTGYAAIRPPQFLSVEIPLPPLDEQRRIVARIEELAARIEQARVLRREAMTEAEALLTSERTRLIGPAQADNWTPIRTYVQHIENGWSPACESRPASEAEWGVLKVGAVSFGAFNPMENKALPPSLEPDSRYEVRAGDFLMSRANTKELVGACALVRSTRPRLMLSDKIFRFVFANGASIEPSYLDQVLKSRALRDQIERKASGTSPTMKNISKEAVLDLRIPPHDLQQQQYIVSRLCEATAQIGRLSEVQREVDTELDAVLPSVLDKAFRGEL